MASFQSCYYYNTFRGQLSTTVLNDKIRNKIIEFYNNYVLYDNQGPHSNVYIIIWYVP